MDNFNDIIRQYNFHDSIIDKIIFDPCSIGLMRKLTLGIDYYNWEGNNIISEKWHWKKMTFEIEHCFLLRYEFPNIIEGGNEIYDIELYDSDIKQIEENFNRNRSNIYFNALKDKVPQFKLEVQ